MAFCGFGPACIPSIAAANICSDPCIVYSLCRKRILDIGMASGGSTLGAAFQKFPIQVAESPLLPGRFSNLISKVFSRVSTEKKPTAALYKGYPVDLWTLRYPHPYHLQLQRATHSPLHLPLLSNLQRNQIVYSNSRTFFSNNPALSPQIPGPIQDKHR